jgi:hypothetical protein
MSEDVFNANFKLSLSEVLQHVNIKSDGVYSKNESVTTRIVALYKVQGFVLNDTPNGLVFAKIK